MTRLTRALVIAAAAVALTAPGAGAHTSSPQYHSVLQGLSPAVPGVQLAVLGGDEYLQLTSHSAKTVTVFGYDGEPYARILADGTVQQNHNSPAYYLNQDFFGTTKVPDTANAKATPDWRTVDRTAKFVWHDHRIHWMAAGLPPAVKDKAKPWTIQSFAIKLRVGSTPVTDTGSLFWRPQKDGFPIAAIIALIAAGGAGVAFVVVVRRRRDEEHAADGDTTATREAW